MSVAVKSRGANKHHLPTAARECLVERGGELWTEEVVVLCVDPQHGNVGGFTEITESPHQLRWIAHLVRSFRAAATGKTDRGEQVPGGGSAVSATLANPPVETPTLMMREGSTCGSFER